ncbi:hypothetical protein DUI87_12924 [Hirundo rustica rustica]|uniref:Uncharacterized protein n=1 Tax=Hirundo rustica rustica TaxID=333673 RepID=A0A3M0KAA3_HIRRU|nr:hypothetical protein DUI87_12924 [Hirundo rustica rustica]
MGREMMWKYWEPIRRPKSCWITDTNYQSGDHTFNIDKDITIEFQNWPILQIAHPHETQRQTKEDGLYITIYILVLKVNFFGSIYLTEVPAENDNIAILSHIPILMEHDMMLSFLDLGRDSSLLLSPDVLVTVK